MAWALRRLSGAAGEPPAPPAERRAPTSAPAPRPTRAARRGVIRWSGMSEREQQAGAGDRAERRRNEWGGARRWVEAGALLGVGAGVAAWGAAHQPRPAPDRRPTPTTTCCSTCPEASAARSSRATARRSRSSCSGPRTAPPIVFIHGWTCARRFWTGQLHGLADRYRIVTYDLRGHGDSAPAGRRRLLDRRARGGPAGGAGGDRPRRPQGAARRPLARRDDDRRLGRPLPARGRGARRRRRAAQHRPRRPDRPGADPQAAVRDETDQGGRGRDLPVGQRAAAAGLAAEPARRPVRRAVAERDAGAGRLLPADGDRLPARGARRLRPHDVAAGPAARARPADRPDGRARRRQRPAHAAAARRADGGGAARSWPSGSSCPSPAT